MVSVGALVRFEAKPDRVDEVEELLRGLGAQVEREESTIGWFGSARGRRRSVCSTPFPTGQAAPPTSRRPVRR
jgi:hypothetical protein